MRFHAIGATLLALILTGLGGAQALESQGQVLPYDFNGDGVEDFYVIDPDGGSHWLLFEDGVLQELTDATDPWAALPTREARLADLDQDGRADLVLIKKDGRQLALLAGSRQLRQLAPEAHLALGVTVTATPTGPATPTSPQPIPTCGASIQDRGELGACLQAGSSPKLGRLLPLGQALFVSPTGEVGVNTLSPTDPLTVAGAIETLSGGLRFPDGTLQSTATLPGPPGGPGPQGPPGVQGPQGPQGANGFLSLNSQSGPNLSIVGSGSASVTASGSTITVSSPTALCTYASKPYSGNAVCYTSGNAIPCSFGFQALKLQCRTNGTWQVITSSQCFNPSAGPICGS